jgi:hypothetical protein
MAEHYARIAEVDIEQMHRRASPLTIESFDNPHLARVFTIDLTLWRLIR